LRGARRHQRAGFGLDQVNHGPRDDGRVMGDPERIAGRMVGRIVLGQPDRDQRVVAKAFAKIGDDRFAGDRPDGLRDCSKRALRRLLG
jgi:hypothetical protein